MRLRLSNRLSRLEPEPSPALYTWFAGGSLMKAIYQRYLGDLVYMLPQGVRFLDVGTGPGIFLGLIQRQRPDLNLVGLDKSSGMMFQARALSKASGTRSPAWVTGTAEELPFRPASFDAVLATLSLHHWQDPVTAVAEIRRVLNDAGRAWIYELNRDASLRDLKEYALETKQPLMLVYLVFNLMRWHSTLRQTDFLQVFRLAGISSWGLKKVHHIFWRAEIYGKN